MARFPPLAHAFVHIQKRSPQNVVRLLRLPPRRGSVSGGSDHMRRFSSAIFPEFQVCAGPGAKEPTARPDEISHSTVCRTSL